MLDVEKPKATSFRYGREHQAGLLEKYRNRHRNHGRFRVQTAHDLVARHALPRLGGLPPD